MRNLQEYSFFAPHDNIHLVELMGGNVSFICLLRIVLSQDSLKSTFIKRLDTYFKVRLALDLCDSVANKNEERVLWCFE